MLSSTEDKLSRDLEVDRPVSFGSPCQRRLGLDRVLHHRWRENRRRRLSTQKCVLAVIRHAMATPWVCEVYVDSLEISVGSVLTPVL